MLLILTSDISNRITYIADLMFRKMLGIDVRLTTSTEEFNSYNGPKLGYAREPVADGIFIEASGFLSEKDIIAQDVKFFKIEGIPVLFKSVSRFSALPFDPFAAAFYLVSRYEEYLPHQKDPFGRYQATASIAWKADFLEIPVIHFWAARLESVLMEHYPGTKFNHRQYQYIPTIDIDHAWCYLGRTLARTIGGVGRSLVHGRLQEITGRFKTLAGMSPDPYDNYAYIRRVHDQYAGFPLFFILFADYGMKDNNVSIGSKAFDRLIRELDLNRTVGIHPSLSSNTHPEKLDSEYTGLCRVLGREVTISRQHFLKFSMPDTYRALVQLGITDDYSMGYASHTGFRAGIAIPFPFFDLTKDEATKLIIHPVSLMDVTMKNYLRLTTVESLEKIDTIIQIIKSVGGEYVSLWHNESLGDTEPWAGWRVVYERMVKLASA